MFISLNKLRAPNVTCCSLNLKKVKGHQAIGIGVNIDAYRIYELSGISVEYRYQQHIFFGYLRPMSHICSIRYHGSIKNIPR